LSLALSQPDWNTIGLFAALFMGVVFGPRFFRASAAKAREEELQRTVEAYKGRVEALEAIEQAHMQEIASMRGEVRKCQSEASKWEARYHEQAKYTAKDSLDLVAKELTASRTAMMTGFENQAELILKTIEMQSQTLEATRVNGDQPPS
jgi:hypothetical protein